jgi:hypothetical protein
MSDADGWYPGVDDPVHATPRHTMPLTAPPERAQPSPNHSFLIDAMAPRHGAVEQAQVEPPRA